MLLLFSEVLIPTAKLFLVLDHFDESHFGCIPDIILIYSYFALLFMLFILYLSNAGN